MGQMFDPNYFNKVFLPVVKDIGEVVTAKEKVAAIPEIIKGQLEYVKRCLGEVEKHIDQELDKVREVGGQ